MQRKTGYVYSTDQDPVVYTQVQNNNGLLKPGPHEPKTARKISNTTSLHSFAGSQPTAKQSAKKFSVA